jgi:phosphomannomutase
LINSEHCKKNFQIDYSMEGVMELAQLDRKQMFYKIKALDSSMLREYDIRGVVGKTLFEDDAYTIGLAFGTMLKKQGKTRAVVARDGRLSSKMLEKALVLGLTQTGMEVVQIGLGPTPMLYYTVYTNSSCGGVMITGSHNPSEYNGFKFVNGKEPFFGDDIQELGKIAKEKTFHYGVGTSYMVNVKARYLSKLLKAYSGKKELKVVWDAGNGAAGQLMTRLTQKLPGKHILLNEKIDGTFPAHHPDPTVPENLKQLIETVISSKADLGIAFDGDGDRIGVVDSNGRILFGDQIMMIFSEDVLKANPAATIIADVKASQCLFDKISICGGVPLMWRTGHSLIKTKMKEINSPLAGEMSGHIFFADKYFGFDDALYAAVRLLKILANSNKSLSDYYDAMPKLKNTPELRFECDDERKFDVVKEVRERVENDNLNVNSIDGVRVSNQNGWWLLRASNTQNVLVARCEANNHEHLQKLKNEVAKHLNLSGIKVPADILS